jgi:uncharacterized protein
VRSHAEVARIEISPDCFHILMDRSVREETVEYLKSIGFKYIALDLQGFRSGSGNEGIINQTSGREGKGQGE